MMAPLSYAHRFEPGEVLAATPLLLLHGTGGDENDLLPVRRMTRSSVAGIFSSRCITTHQRATVPARRANRNHHRRRHQAHLVTVKIDNHIVAQGPQFHSIDFAKKRIDFRTVQKGPRLVTNPRRRDVRVAKGQ
jgi:hypothetical protein